MAKFKTRFLLGLLPALSISLWACVKVGFKYTVTHDRNEGPFGSEILLSATKSEDINMHQEVALSIRSNTVAEKSEMKTYNDTALAMDLSALQVQINSAGLPFQQRRKSQPYSESNFSASVTPSHYLKFINTLHADELSLGSVSEGKKMEMENLIRFGQGLEPYVTERGETAFIENGIVYRPWRRPDPSTMHKLYPSPYTAEYELYIPFNEELFFEGRKPDRRYKTERKIILWYTPCRYVEPKENPQPLKSCPDFPCYITTNKNYRENSSAMIFAAQILEGAPPKRRPDQIFILHNHEPPYVNRHFDSSWRKGFKQPGWKRAFNWTMTYRMDSDLIAPYGVVRRRPTPLVNKDYKGIVANKTKAVAWIVSNCKTSSRRGVYMKELQKYISVDVFGKCGNFECPHQDDGKCAQMINEKYKFYIGFENAFCADYITEKTFHYLTMDTITIARGSNEHFQHVPKEIFINTADFPSPKKLAERLQYLDDNDYAYVDMLKEKDKYMSNVEGFPVRHNNGHIRFVAYRQDSPAVCRACQRLWNLDKYAQSVPDIHKWFDSKVCQEPEDLKF